MRNLLIVVCFAACAVLFTGEAAHARHLHRSRGVSGTFQGTIYAVHQHSVVIDIGTTSSKHLMVEINTATHVASASGKKGTIADLVAGQYVTATVKRSRASSIVVTAPAPTPQ